jgi:hypothetical protein
VDHIGRVVLYKDSKEGSTVTLLVWGQEGKTSIDGSIRSEINLATLGHGRRLDRGAYKLIHQAGVVAY